MADELLCEKIRSLQPYRPDIGGPVSIHLDANESFIPLSETLRQKIGAEIAAAAFHRYPDPLAAAACAAFGRRYGIDPACLTAGNGSDELISVLMNTFVQRGEKVVLTEPDFSMYRIYCGMAELTPVVIGKGRDLTFDPEEMIAAANREHPRLILFSNPCNPTGQGLPADAVLNIVRRAGCLVVVDEAYMDFWDESILGRATEWENLIVLRTCSKVGLAGARLGFAAAGPRLTERLRAAKSPYNVNSLTQAAGAAFLNDRGFLDGTIAAIRRSRDSLYESLQKRSGAYPGRMTVFPSHTNFVTVRMPDAAACHRRLRKRGISVRLIGEELLRITTGSDSENRSLLAALDAVLAGSPEGKGDSR